MIKNEAQHEYSKEWVEKFKRSIAAMDRDEEAQKKDYLKWEMGRGSLVCHVEQLESEISEYERLMSCDKSQPIKIVVENLTKLTDALIKARMAAKMSQKELAEILDLDEQQIQEWEKTGYSDVSFVKLVDICCVLGLEFKTAVMEVNFEKIEASKRIVKEWQERKLKKASKASI
ncbi:MAG TPA: helix-turn-helix transcriptional regulator [Oscillatoriales cyanobacterium M59_W2019_021]|nr:helix-turn-helix transcriptional regulator [Oscillatoriales cyanobacterium M4454_W2019_049]HIK52895.1 helix-turn-helix transcriptional regulator [Oscillatoriales cyanobacterium M59_W2019_021]